MASLKSNVRTRRKKPASSGRPQVTTVRLDPEVQKGLRLLQTYSGINRPLNKWINLALADFIAKQSASLERELDQALKNVRAYRRNDPGYKRAIESLIDAEASLADQDPMEGGPEPRPAGPAVSLVREALDG
jgi:predicted transcriptional regulator